MSFKNIFLLINIVCLSRPVFSAIGDLNALHRLIGGQIIASIFDNLLTIKSDEEFLFVIKNHLEDLIPLVLDKVSSINGEAKKRLDDIGINLFIPKLKEALIRYKRINQKKSFELEQSQKTIGQLQEKNQLITKELDKRNKRRIA